MRKMIHVATASHDALQTLARETGQTFQDLGGKAPEDIIAGLGEAARIWTGGKPPNDDVTFVAVRVRA